MRDRMAVDKEKMERNTKGKRKKEKQPVVH